jgi:NO-binding membrane sensor protein with MHYT domain/two-component sensor histidine kinase
MVGTFDPWLVLLSAVLAVNASFVALDFASRVTTSRGSRAAWGWFAGGMLSMGTGIWSMHFVGMAAFRLPVRMSFDVWITVASWLSAVLASGCGLFVATRGTLNATRLLGAGVLMGVGIASMHYVGMAAMRVQPPIDYAPFLVAMSVLIAVAASVTTVWCAFELRLDATMAAFWKKAGSAIVMGGGICGMHYVGMAAARFAPDSICTSTPLYINNTVLGATLGGFTLLFQTGTLLVAAYDAHMSSVLDARVAQRSVALAESSSQLRRLLWRLNDALEEERRRLAGELHDIVGQNLAALSAEIALIRSGIERAEQNSLVERVANASALARQSVEAVRSVMAQLRPPGLDVLGVRAALRWHADAFQSRTGIAVTLELDESLPRAPEALEDTVLRICVEALNNAGKHAAAHSVRVRLQRSAGEITLEIADDGRGFDVRHPTPREDNSGWGLLIMKERALAIGAELRIVSALETGTRVVFSIAEHLWR